MKVRHATVIMISKAVQVHSEIGDVPAKRKVIFGNLLS